MNLFFWRKPTPIVYDETFAEIAKLCVSNWDVFQWFSADIGHESGYFEGTNEATFYCYMFIDNAKTLKITLKWKRCGFYQQNHKNFSLALSGNGVSVLEKIDDESGEAILTAYNNQSEKISNREATIRTEKQQALIKSVLELLKVKA